MKHAANAHGVQLTTVPAMVNYIESQNKVAQVVMIDYLEKIWYNNTNFDKNILILRKLGKIFCIFLQNFL